MLSEQLHGHVRQAIGTLPSRQAEVVTYRYILGYSTAQTAKLMCVAQGTVKAALYQALHKLQKDLSGLSFDD